MKELIKNMNLLSGIRAKITSKETMESLESEIRSSFESLDVNVKSDDLEISEAAGLYYIEAKFPFNTGKGLDEFGVKWGKYRAKTKLPVGVSRYYVTRAKKHTKSIRSGEYIPFYLGKSENIKQRVIEHLEGSVDSDTYSLKLRSRPGIIKNVDFRIGYVALNINNDAYFGVELIERELREILNPIIGKQ